MSYKKDLLDRLEKAMEKYKADPLLYQELKELRDQVEKATRWGDVLDILNKLGPLLIAVLHEIFRPK